MTRNISVNCLYCVDRGQTPDTTRNLHIRSDGLYVCHRCGAKPSVTGRLPRELLVWDHVGFADTEVKIWQEPRQPDKTHRVDKCGGCWDFILQRDCWMSQARVPSWLTGGWYDGHRIFFMDEATGWWQGRAVSDRNSKRYTTKLGYTVDMAPMLDMDPGSKYSVPVIVEGPTDGLRLYSQGIRAIVLFGKSFSPKKLERLQTILWVRPKAMVCLDRDGCDAERQRWVWELSKFVAVGAWVPVAADPGEMDDAEIAQLKEKLR